MDKRKKRNGTYNDTIGFYNPMEAGFKLEINDQKLADWIKKGAQLSEGMAKLLKYYNSIKKKQN